MSIHSRIHSLLRITGITISLMSGIFISDKAFAIPKFLKAHECGIASTYSSGYQTANGEIYNHLGISAAHKYLPFGTQVRIIHQHTRKSIVVRINDRGPFIPGRIIDLSTGAKRAFGMDGLAPVCLEVIKYGGKIHADARNIKGIKHLKAKRHHKKRHKKHSHKHLYDEKSV